MNKRMKLIKASTVIGYIVCFLYIVLTACLFSVSNLWYWLTLVLALISLYNSLYSSYLNSKLKEEPFESIKLKFLINSIISIVSLPSFIINLIAYFDNKPEKYVLVDNEEYVEEIK